MSPAGLTCTAFAASAVKLLPSASSSGLQRNTHGPAPVTATRTPPAVCATNTPTSAKRDAGCDELHVGGLLRHGEAHRRDELVVGERGLVHALEEIVGRDLALVRVHDRVQAEHRGGIARGRIVVGDRAAERAHVAHLAVADALGERGQRRDASAFTSGDDATSAWRVIAPIDEVLAFLADALQLRHAGEVDQRARLRQAQLHRRDEALAAGERRAAGLREQRGGVGDANRPS